jgi:GT2 family glycosyltransferase
LFESDLTGAIYLISKEVYKNPNIKYGYTQYGEDLYWCITAKQQGYKLYTDITLYQQHIMSEEILQKYLDKTLEIPSRTRT